MFNFTIWQYMNFIMAASTKSNTVRYFYSEFGGIFPRLDMVDNCLVFARHIFFTVLANFVISSKTLVTPFYVLPIIKLPFGVKFRFGTLSSTLSCAIRFIRTSSRTIKSGVFLIRENPESVCTPYTVSIKALFLHNNRSILVNE